MKKERLTRAGGILARKINFYDPQPPKTRSYAEKSTSRWIWLCQKDRIVTIQQLTLVLGRRARKGAVPLSLIGHIQLLISFTSVVGPESREADGCPSFLEKRDRTRAELLHRKSSQCTQISPQGHRVRAPCPNKRRKDCVCHRVSITRTRIHTQS